MKIDRTLLMIGAFVAVALAGVFAGGGSMFLGGGDAEPTPISSDGQTASAKPTDQKPADAKATPGANRATPTPAALVSAGTRPVAKPGPLLLINPAVGAAGSAVSVAGSGFDPGSTVDVTLKRNENDKGQDLGFAQADQGGSFGGINFNIPDGIVGTFTVVAQQEKSDKRATATGQVQGASPSVKFGTQVGKPGDRLTVSARGFAPGENVHIFFNTIGGEPIATLPADQSGSLGRASVTVPYGAAGNNSFIFMGERSQSPVTVQFLMLNFYPAAGLSTYATKPDTTITFSGTGFGPSEQVSIYINSLQSPPVASVQSSEEGAFANVGEFVVPFSLAGKNTFIFIGDKSQAAVTAGFDVLPYTPYAEASTYGARPGTTITFYGRDFARNEIVRVYVGRGQNSSGREVSCFRTDNRGGIGGGGGYTIPHDAQAGKTSFALIGDKSKVEAPVAFQIMDAGGPVAPHPDEAKEFRCPYQEDQGDVAPSPAAPVPEVAPQTQQPGPQQPAVPTQLQAAPQQQPKPSEGQAKPTQPAAPSKPSPTAAGR